MPINYYYQIIRIDAVRTRSANRVWRNSQDLCKWACRERQFVAEKDNYAQPGSALTTAPGVQWIITACRSCAQHRSVTWSDTYTCR